MGRWSFCSLSMLTPSQLYSAAGSLVECSLMNHTAAEVEITHSKWVMHRRLLWDSLLLCWMHPITGDWATCFGQLFPRWTIPTVTPGYSVWHYLYAHLCPFSCSFPLRHFFSSFANVFLLLCRQFKELYQHWAVPHHWGYICCQGRGKDHPARAGGS